MSFKMPLWRSRQSAAVAAWMLPALTGCSALSGLPPSAPPTPIVVQAPRPTPLPKNAFAEPENAASYSQRVSDWLLKVRASLTDSEASSTPAAPSPQPTVK